MHDTPRQGRSRSGSNDTDKLRDSMAQPNVCEKFIGKRQEQKLARGEHCKAPPTETHEHYKRVIEEFEGWTRHQTRVKRRQDDLRGDGGSFNTLDLYKHILSGPPDNGEAAPQSHDPLRRHEQIILMGAISESKHSEQKDKFNNSAFRRENTNDCGVCDVSNIAERFHKRWLKCCICKIVKPRSLYTNHQLTNGWRRCCRRCLRRA